MLSTKIVEYINRLIYFLDKFKSGKTKTELILDNIKNEYLTLNKIRIIQGIKNRIFGVFFNDKKVLKQLVKDPDFKVRIKSAALLETEGLKYLLGYFKKTSRLQQKKIIIQAIAEFEEKEAQKFILDCLRTEANIMT